MNERTAKEGAFKRTVERHCLVIKSCRGPGIQLQVSKTLQGQPCAMKVACTLLRVLGESAGQVSNSLLFDYIQKTQSIDSEKTKFSSNLTLRRWR